MCVLRLPGTMRATQGLSGLKDVVGRRPRKRPASETWRAGVADVDDVVQEAQLAPAARLEAQHDLEMAPPYDLGGGTMLLS